MHRIGKVQRRRRGKIAWARAGCNYFGYNIRLPRRGAWPPILTDQMTVRWYPIAPTRSRVTTTQRTLLGREGIVVKKRSSQNRPRARGGSWFKHRLDRGQEFVIGGFSGGGPFEGLLVGYYKARRLIYAGKFKAATRLLSGWNCFVGSSGS